MSGCDDFCGCGGSSGPLLMFRRNLAMSSFILGYFFDKASFYSSQPAARGTHSARAAVEISPTGSCSSSFENGPMGEEDRSGTALTRLLTIAAPTVLGFSLGGVLVGVSVLCCRRRQPHGVPNSRRGGGRVVD